MTTDAATPNNRERWLVAVLQRLLTLEPSNLSTAITEAAEQVAEVLGADKVDVFFCVPAEEALVAKASSDTPMGRRQRELSLDRLPLDGGGRTVEVFRTGQPHRADHVDQDANELRKLVDDLGVRSSLTVPLEVAGVGRGVLLASSATPAAFNEADLEFLEAVARWLGSTAARLVQAEVLTAQAAKEPLRQAARQCLLTPRQHDVAGLIRQGLNNTEIAAQLVVEPGTVTNHVAAILDRLGFRSRSQIGVWAAERGLGQQPPETQQA